MAAWNKSLPLKLGLSVGFFLLLAVAMFPGVAIQAQAPATASVSQLGTVKSIEGTTVTLLTDQKQTIAVSVPAMRR